MRGGIRTMEEDEFGDDDLDTIQTMRCISSNNRRSRPRRD